MSFVLDEECSPMLPCLIAFAPLFHLCLSSAISASSSIVSCSGAFMRMEPSSQGSGYSAAHCTSMATMSCIGSGCLVVVNADQRAGLLKHWLTTRRPVTGVSCSGTLLKLVHYSAFSVIREPEIWVQARSLRVFLNFPAGEAGSLTFLIRFSVVLLGFLKFSCRRGWFSYFPNQFFQPGSLKDSSLITENALYFNRNSSPGRESYNCTDREFALWITVKSNAVHR